MIILKVIGGLGNQMFQVAYARALSLEFNEDVYLDVSVYNKYKIRDFSLSNLIISDSFKYLADSEVSKYNQIYLKTSQISYHIFQKIIKELTNKDKFGEKPFYFLSKKGLYYNFDRYYYKTIFSKRDLKCIYGYFQSEKYFMKYKEKITKELKVKTPLTEQERVLLDEILSCDSVGVSIRIGDDYLNSSSLNVCDRDFYYKAMEYIYSINKDVVFYIFSDSVNRVKEQFNFKFPVRYVEGFKDYESLRLMYSCKHFVISNSSFSWWGAYLSENENKIVVAPSKWYNDTKIKPDIYLEDMKLIEV